MHYTILFFCISFYCALNYDLNYPSVFLDYAVFNCKKRSNEVVDIFDMHVEAWSSTPMRKEYGSTLDLCGVSPI